jgi:hypothetical protein
LNFLINLSLFPNVRHKYSFQLIISDEGERRKEEERGGERREKRKKAYLA